MILWICPNIEECGGYFGSGDKLKGDTILGPRDHHRGGKTTRVDRRACSRCGRKREPYLIEHFGDGLQGKKLDVKDPK